MTKVAFALSGGGSLVSFQVGALRYLWDLGLRPAIVAGTSGGAINALKMAEGELAKHRNPSLDLTVLWWGLSNSSSMFSEESWFKALKKEAPEIAANLDGHVDRKDVAVAFVIPVLGLVSLVRDLLSLKNDLKKLEKLLANASRGRSIYNLGPTRKLLEREVDPQNIAKSGISLRLSVVSLETGRLRFVNEDGHFVDADADGRFVDVNDRPEDPSVSLIDAAIASAAIPAIFRDVPLAGEHYVDGGVREMVPIRAALDAGATKVYAIVAGKRNVSRKSGYKSATAVEIAERAVKEILLSEIQENETHPYLPWSSSVTVIQSSGHDLHTGLEVDPGFVRIDIEYGWMRASDVHRNVDAEVMELVDEIVHERTKARRMEAPFGSGPRGGGRKVGSARATWIGARVRDLPEIRKSKRRVKELVLKRMRRGGRLPPWVDLTEWWLDYEYHEEKYGPSSPWDVFSRVPKETPPRLAPWPEASGIEMVQSRSGTKGNFELVAPMEAGLGYYWRDNDAAGLPWRGPYWFGQDPGDVEAVSVFQSSLGPSITLEVIGRTGNRLAHYWWDPSGKGKWHGPSYFGSEVSGTPSFLQGRLPTDGNYAAVAPAESGGLHYYWCENAVAGEPWAGPRFFGSNAGAVNGVSMIQSSIGPPGNLQVVAQVGKKLAHFSCDSNAVWHGPRYFGTDVSGTPSFIQSRFGNRGNFEVVVPMKTGGLGHYWRDNDVASEPWHGPSRFGQTVGEVQAVSLVQSNFGSPGNLEVVALCGGQLVHFWRDSGPSFEWHGPSSIT